MMRNLLSIFFLSAFLLCTAQTKTYVGLKFGGLGSTSYMNHSVLPVVMKINWLPGATGGLQVMHFSEKFESKVNFGIQTGVNITGKGWVQRFEGIKNHKTRINYLEIPLEAVGYFGNKNKYFVTAGFFMEYALS
ncbi:MAG: outer membrane beta-barrel protein, partial [Cyclobacteriaceae bacterium]